MTKRCWTRSIARWTFPNFLVLLALLQSISLQLERQTAGWLLQALLIHTILLHLIAPLHSTPILLGRRDGNVCKRLCKSLLLVGLLSRYIGCTNPVKDWLRWLLLRSLREHLLNFLGAFCHAWVSCRSMSGCNTLFRTISSSSILSLAGTRLKVSLAEQWEWLQRENLRELWPEEQDKRKDSERLEGKKDHSAVIWAVHKFT